MSRTHTGYNLPKVRKVKLVITSRSHNLFFQTNLNNAILKILKF